MRPSLVVLLVVILGGGGGIAVRQASLSRLRSENSHLREQAQVANRLRQENSELQRLRATNAEVARLREETRELHRLRNEIRRLNEQTAELETLRSENASLRSATSNRSAGQPRNATSWDQPLTMDQMSPQGTATPEATLQTFFWAVRELDFPTLANCLTPEAQAGLSNRSREQLESELQDLRARLRSVRLVARQQAPSGGIELGVELLLQGTDSPEANSFPFERSGNEWRLDFPIFP